jgi:hypothetical protein
MLLLCVLWDGICVVPEDNEGAEEGIEGRDQDQPTNSECVCVAAIVCCCPLPSSLFHGDFD